MLLIYAFLFFAIPPFYLSFFLLFAHRDQKKFFCTGARPLILPSRKLSCARTYTHMQTNNPPPTYTHLQSTYAHSPTSHPPHTHTLHAYTLATGHTSGGLRAQPSAAHPAHLPPSVVPTFPTYAALALGKVAGALALALAKRKG